MKDECIVNDFTFFFKVIEKVEGKYIIETHEDPTLVPTTNTVKRKINSELDLPINKLLYTNTASISSKDKQVYVTSYYALELFTIPESEPVTVLISEQLKNMILDDTKFPVDMFFN